MKSFRLVALSAALTLGSFGTIFYNASCSKDECKDVTCQNGGTCDAGTCKCPTGYEGTSCETEVRKKIVKTWSATDTKSGSTTSLPSYLALITNGTNISDVKIASFSNSFFTAEVKATFVGNTLTIPNQTPDNDGYSVSGTGTYDATTGKISITYSLTDTANQVLNYSGTWSSN